MMSCSVRRSQSSESMLKLVDGSGHSFTGEKRSSDLQMDMVSVEPAESSP